MAGIEQLVIAITSGAAVGSIYGLIAASYHLMFTVRGAVSFAQGDLTMLAGFVFISILGCVSSPLAALLVVVALISLGSGLVERICIRPAIKQGVTTWHGY
jgi:branched-chain amino acid transport system permease protein